MNENISDREFDMNLEELRKAGLDSVTNTNACMTPQELVDFCGGLHAAWLFHTFGRPALQSLCQSLSSVASDRDGSWYHFAGILEISWLKIECILNDKSGRDKSELCLLTYAQSSNSTLEEIIKALDTVKRYDALATVEPSMKILVDLVKSNRDCHRSRLKIHSTTNKSEEGDGNNSSNELICPKGYSKLSLHLPTALRELSFVNESKISSKVINKINHIKEEASVQLTSPTSAKVVPYSKVVLLTFSEDGEEAAYRIAHTLRNPKTDRRPFGVLILDENANKLQANPELIVPTLFQQVDYVMPIITKGYLEAIQCDTIATSRKDMLSSLDANCVQYIFDLMTKYYVKNSCRNDKFRCVVVGDNNDQLKNLVNDPLFANKVTLKAWVYESDVEKLAQLLSCAN